MSISANNVNLAADANRHIFDYFYTDRASDVLKHGSGVVVVKVPFATYCSGDQVANGGLASALAS